MPAGALDPIIDEAAPIAAAFRAAGHRLYLVGGIVRDLMLGKVISDQLDLDFTTDATPEEIKTLVGPLVDALWVQGERFGTIGAKLAGREYEITTHRSEVYPAESRKPVVVFSKEIEEDLSRRDFTVNAMAIEVPSRELIDPFGGRADMTAKLLRTPLDPEVSFTDDPLRMLRAARFVAGLELEPVAELESAMSALRDRLDIVSIERVRDELDKLLAVPDPVPGLQLLAASRLLERFLPEAMDESVFARPDTLRALEPQPLIRLAAVLYGTPASGVAERLRKLRYSNDRRKDTVRLLRATETLVGGAVVDEAALRRWVASAGERRGEAKALAIALAPTNAAVVARADALEGALSHELDDLQPTLSGEDIMAVLDREAGPVIGEAAAYLQELRFDEGPLSPDEERERLRRWWEARSVERE